MHDTLRYFGYDPVHRRYHQNELTFGLVYAFSENFILPLSHDEVVHGKGSLLAKMPGDRWQQFANLRAAFALMFAHPGKKLLFMGDEIAHDGEWNHDAQLDWELLGDPPHDRHAALVRDCNRLYRGTPRAPRARRGPRLRVDRLSGCGEQRRRLLRDARRGEFAVRRVCNATPVRA